MMSDEPLTDQRVREVFNNLERTEFADAGPVCECQCGISELAHAPCGRRATELVRLHRWDWCTDPLPDPEAGDLEGNLCAVMCAGCADHAVAVAKSKIALLLADPGNYGSCPSCPSCGRATQCWQDILDRRPM